MNQYKRRVPSILSHDPSFHLLTPDLQNNPDYKLYRFKWKNNPEHFKVGEFPIHLDLELNTTCNYSCPKCFQSFEKPQPQYMDWRLYQKIIDEGAEKGLCSIKLQYRGEPLCSPILIDAVKYAKRAGIIEVMFNTNASLLITSMSAALMKAGLVKIICSVEGSNCQDYLDNHHSNNFYLVLSNIAKLQALKSKYKIFNPIIRVQKVSRNFNHEASYLSFWERIADQVAIDEYFDYQDQTEDERILENFHCHQLWQRLVVLTDGRVLSCCGTNNTDMVVGDANRISIETIWKKSRILENMRILHREGNSHKIQKCRICHLRKGIRQNT